MLYDKVYAWESNEEISNLFFCVVNPLLNFSSVELSVQSQRVYI